MPTNRRRKGRSRRAGRTERGRWADFALEFGAAPGDHLNPFPDEEAMKAYWAEFRDEILSERSSTSGAAGRRPHCWWEWDAPEPLRDDESVPEYLDRLKLWQPGERESWERAEAAMAAYLETYGRR